MKITEVTDAALEGLVAKYGEVYRKLIIGSLLWLKRHEPEWELCEPLEVEKYLDELIASAGRGNRLTITLKTNPSAPSVATIYFPVWWCYGDRVRWLQGSNYLSWIFTSSTYRSVGFEAAVVYTV